MATRRAQRPGSSRRRRAALALLCAGAILLASGPRAASAEGALEKVSTVGAITLDALLLRPIGAAALVMGCIFFTASLPFVAPFEGTQDSLDTFVYPQYEYTIVRRLGDL